MKDKVHNICHDPEILQEAQNLGVRDKAVINQALSKGEATMYGGVDRATGFLAWISQLRKANQERQVKKRLSKKQKQEIISRSMQNE